MTPERYRQYAEWWLWARETLHGPVPRLRAAARAGMEAQSFHGATVASAVDTALHAFQEGSEYLSSQDDPAQRYAELYVRARLARRLDFEAAHAAAAEAFSTWKDASDISTAIRPRINISAIVATGLLVAGVVALAVAFFLGFGSFGSLSGSALLASALFASALFVAAGVLGLFAFGIGLSARSRIKYSNEAGGAVAVTSVGCGCLLAVLAGLAALVILVSLMGEAFAPVG